MALASCPHAGSGTIAALLASPLNERPRCGEPGRPVGDLRPEVGEVERPPLFGDDARREPEAEPRCEPAPRVTSGARLAPTAWPRVEPEPSAERVETIVSAFSAGAAPH